MSDAKQGTLGELLALAHRKLPTQADALDIFARWNLSSTDYAATAIHKRLQAAAKDWPPGYSEEVFTAVESIAQAELAKSSWNPKDKKTRQWYERIARDALTAARLAKAISGWIPPSVPAESELNDLIARLAAFASASLEATSLTDADLAALRARVDLERLKEKQPRKAPSRRLLADLVWLAANKNSKEPLNESTLRRYASGRRHTPSARYWQRGWPVMRETGRLGRNEHRDRFKSEIEQLLPGKNVSTRSAQ